MKVDVRCKFCGHNQSEEIKEKQTIICHHCHRPSDVWADGRTEISALYFVTGKVNYNQTMRGMCHHDLVTIDEEKLRPSVLNALIKEARNA